MKQITKLMLILLSIFAISLDVSAQYQTGDVFVAVGNGQVQWRQPDGTLVQTLNTGQGGYTTGMALDTGNNLYVTNFSASTVSKFDDSGNLIGLFGSGYSTPESIVFDNQSNVYVGNLGNGIRKFDYNGNFLGTVGPGTDFFDLQADQCTALITHEGSVINRHDLCTNTPLTDFATGISGNAYALRIRTNGEVLLADGGVIRRFNSAGAEIQTYDATGENSWFALNLDPDGTSFWSADFSTSNVYRIDIATGSVITSFNTGTGSSSVFGLAVAGEITVATQLFITLTPHDATNPINTQHCVTATVVDQFNVPQAGVNVSFVVTGVNGVLNGNGQTNGSGQVQYCYVGTAAGRDTITGRIGTTATTDVAYKTWTDDPLPVELVSFTSIINNQNVTLNWSTASELNNSGFDIERSAVEGQWTKVGNVQGNGTTNEVMNYQFTDRNVTSGTYNYRLKQIDFNGNFEYFNLSDEIIVGVPNNFSLSQNYPNPFNPTTKIDFQLPSDGNVKITVYDNSGKLVSELVNGYKTAGYHTVTFDAANISSGVYFYKLESGNFSKVMKMTVLK
ncbi:MAG TPA: T9SS type A sorting domain-containing protein [Ignavibacteria bacterium]|nr:T9SS type A sorting domain-containing protein [Ignavibacteria bacterium]HMR41077.1 T9SS type A sorting domain-containing protein [Ignavibacteria bacterium]